MKPAAEGLGWLFILGSVGCAAAKFVDAFGLCGVLGFISATAIVLLVARRNA